MKLHELVKRIEAIGLKVMLTGDARTGALHLFGVTSPRAMSTDASDILFGCVLEGDDHKPRCYWDEAQITEDLERAAKHPDAIRRRELQAKWAAEAKAREEAKTRVAKAA
jgi:hypothetical protein